MVTAKIEDEHDSKPKEKLPIVKRPTKVRLTIWPHLVAGVKAVQSAVSRSSPSLPPHLTFVVRRFVEKAEGQAKTTFECLQLLLQGRERKDSKGSLC
jgi:hypothetical protein